MSLIWLTIGTPTTPGIVNPLTAACDTGYIPDQVHILSNPGVADSVAAAKERFKAIIDAYDGSAEISTYDLATETDFREIIAFYRSTISVAHETGDSVAVDVTPGRKFMSAIAFQAGFKFDAEHIFYFYRKSGGYYGQFYSEIPRTATELIDFTEVF